MFQTRFKNVVMLCKGQGGVGAVHAKCPSGDDGTEAGGIGEGGRGLIRAGGGDYRAHSG